MKKTICYFVLAFMLLASCSKKSGQEVQYIPFQESDNSLWGMISPTGDVLFNEEFKEKPTIVRDDRFMVRNSDGLWEIFTAEDKPQKIGTEYAFASMYQNGIAVVAEKNKTISLIDRDCNVIKSLDKIDGKTVDAVERFSEGYAVFRCDKYLGVINDKGEKVIEAKYLQLNNCSDGKFIALDRKYEEEVKKDSSNNLKFDVLDTSGKTLFTLSLAKYKDFGSFFQSGLLDIYVESKNEKCGGIINDKGEVVVKPSAKIKKIGQISGKYFTYNNGDGWGLMNLEGESIIRAKYDQLYFASDDMMIAMTKKEGGSNVYKIIDFDDKQIGQDTYDDAYPFYHLNNTHAVVKISSSLFSFVDTDGNQVKKLPDMVHVGFSEGDQVVESDFVDMKALVDALHITENGFDSITFKSTPEEVVNYYSKQDCCWRGSKEHGAADPYWYTSDSELHLWKNVNGVSPDLYVYFSGDISRRTYIEKRVIDYTFGDYYWYHNDKIPTGYVFNRNDIKSFRVVFDNNGKLRNKLRLVFNEISTRFKNMGTVEKENNGACIIKLKNDMWAVVAFEKNKVFVRWGKKEILNYIDIDEYKDAHEETERIKDYDYFDNKLAGIDKFEELGVDSDSIVVVE